MLVLSRFKSEVIHIGPDITVMVVAIGHDRVRIGIDAPKGIPIWRGENTRQEIPDEPMTDPLDGKW